MKMLPIHIILDEPSVIIKKHDKTLAILNLAAVALYIPSTGELTLVNGKTYLISENHRQTLFEALGKIK